MRGSMIFIDEPMRAVCYRRNGDVLLAIVIRMVVLIAKLVIF